MEKTTQNHSQDENQENKDKPEDTKTYASGEEKLLAEENEMIASARPENKKAVKMQYGLLIKGLIERTKQNPEFEEKVLLDHKSVERCIKFCSDKAKELSEPTDQEKADARNNNKPIMVAVGSDLVFEWVEQYYDMDDKAEVEKEKKAAAAQKKRDSKKKADSKKTAPKESEDKKMTKKQEKSKAAASPKKQDKPKEEQMSVFDLLSI